VQAQKGATKKTLAALAAVGLGSARPRGRV